MIKRLIDLLHLRKKQSWAARYFVVILIISALLAMTMSLLIGLAQSVWFDEAYSIMVAKQPVGELLRLTGLDTHPPLYYLLLKGWAWLFGWSELALRSLSVLALGGSVTVGGLLMRRLFGARMALYVLPFLAFAPFLLRYGFEIRMYALATLIGLAATYVLILAYETKTNAHKWLLYAAYAVLVAAGVYTLYYTVFIWLAHVIWLVWQGISNRRPVLKQPWLLAYVGSVVLFLPWIGAFVSQLGNGALAAISQPLTIDNLAGIVSFMFAYQPAWQLNAVMSLVILAVIITSAYFLMKLYQGIDRKRRPYVTLLTLYIAVPLALLALISIVKPMYTERYIAHVVVAAYLLVGLAVGFVLSKKSSKQVKLAAAFLLLVPLVGVAQLASVGNYNFQRLQKPSVAAAAEGVTCGEKQSVLAADPYVAIELAYYLPDCEIHFYSETTSLGGGYAPLSDSPLHVTNPVTQLGGNDDITYLYYAEPQLQLPGFTLKSSDQKDALNISRFSAE